MKIENWKLKITLLVLAIFIFLPKAANAGLLIQRPLYIGLSSGLVGSWSFDGQDMSGNVAFDRSGQGNNGTLTNGPVRAIGRIGQALEFDGSDDLVNAGTGSALNISNNVTISAWVKVDALTVVDGNECVVTRAIDTDNPINYKLCLSNDEVRFVYASGATPVYDVWNTSSANIAPGVWYHIVAHYNGNASPNNSKVKVYVDEVGRSGVWDASDGTETSLPTSASANLLVGAGYSDGTQSINGLIDEVRVYNRALSSDEIKRLYKIGATFKINTKAKVVILTTTTDISYKVPSNWNDTNNTIEVIGGGGAGRSASGGGGGGGGAYAKVSNVSLIKGDSVTIQIGDKGTPGTNAEDTWFNGATCAAATVCANGGLSATSSSRAPGGTTASSTGTTLYAGGTGGAGSLGRGGGGGAAGPGGAGKDGGAGDTDSAGDDAGGGGGGQGGASSTAGSAGGSSGGAGGQGRDGTGSGAGGANGAGAAGTDGGGGGGGDNPAGKGGDGDEWTTAGSGGGGGGGGSGAGGGNNGGNGGLYGAAGGGGGTGGNGGQGIIVLTYVPTFGIIVNKSLASGSLKDGLVGYWSFDGPDMAGNTAFDRSGNANNGTLTNGPTRAIGRIGQALEFDGSDDYVERDSAVITSYPFSMCAWFYTDNGTSNKKLVFIGDKDVDNQWFDLTLETDETVSARVQAGGAIAGAQTTVTFSLNTWNHMCGVYTSATNRTVFLNGGNSVENTTSNTPSGLDRTSIGRRGRLTADQYMDGLIDEVRIYNRVLSSDEIKRLYNLGR